MHRRERHQTGERNGADREGRLDVFRAVATQPMRPYGAAQQVKIGGSRLSLTQAICPPELLGRVWSVIRLVVMAASTMGSVLGGLLGSWFGARTALLMIMTALLLIPLATLAAKPLRGDIYTPAQVTADKSE